MRVSFDEKDLARDSAIQSFSRSWFAFACNEEAPSTNCFSPTYRAPSDLERMQADGSRLNTPGYLVAA